MTKYKCTEHSGGLLRSPLIPFSRTPVPPISLPLLPYPFSPTPILLIFLPLLRCPLPPLSHPPTPSLRSVPSLSLTLCHTRTHTQLLALRHSYLLFSKKKIVGHSADTKAKSRGGQQIYNEGQEKYSVQYTYAHAHAHACRAGASGLVNLYLLTCIAPALGRGGGCM